MKTNKKQRNVTADRTNIKISTKDDSSPAIDLIKLVMDKLTYPIEIILDDNYEDYRNYILCDSKDPGKMRLIGLGSIRMNRIIRDSGYIIIKYGEDFNNSFGLLSDGNNLFEMSEFELLSWHKKHKVLLELDDYKFVDNSALVCDLVCKDRSLFVGITTNRHDSVYLNPYELKNVSENFGYEYIARYKRGRWMEFTHFYKYIDQIISGALKFAVKQNMIYSREINKWQEGMAADMKEVYLTGGLNL